MKASLQEALAQVMAELLLEPRSSYTSAQLSKLDRLKVLLKLDESSPKEPILH